MGTCSAGAIVPSRVADGMSGPGLTLVVPPTANEPRRRVGPYAWVVLEYLASRTDPTTPDTAVTTSVRAIALDLALSKDTVSRALRRLIDAGLVERFLDRASTGQFGNAAYRVHLEHAGLRIASGDDHPARDARTATANVGDGAGPLQARPSPRRLAARRANPAQLSLLDDAAASDS
jgi:DNA-binding transcriptional ArsR family regulator